MQVGFLDWGTLDMAFKSLKKCKICYTWVDPCSPLIYSDFQILTLLDSEDF